MDAFIYGKHNGVKKKQCVNTAILRYADPNLVL